MAGRQASKSPKTTTAKPAKPKAARPKPATPKAGRRAAASRSLPHRLTFVTGNAGKASELRALLAPLGVEVVQDKRGYPEVQADTLREVAEEGARHLLAAELAPPFILEDSGLFVSALRGFPGVYSRYALDTIGLPGLLQLMAGVEVESRGAAFQACLLYVDAAGEMHAFEGACAGRIADRAAGSGGFGFDPVFVPRGHERTFAEMAAEEKSALSHRGQAVRRFVSFLEESTKA